MPSNVFALQCGIDTCQERMDALGTTHSSYVKSGILSKKIKNYHKESAGLLPYLKA